MGTNPAHPSDHQQQHMLDTHNSVAVPGQTNHSSPFLATPAPAQHVQPYHGHPAHSLQQFTQPAPVLQPSTAAAGHIPVSHTGTHAADTAVDINSWLHNPASIPQSPEKELATQQQPTVAIGAHVLPQAAASATAATDQVICRPSGNGVLTAAVPRSSPADEPPAGSVNPDRPAAAVVSSQPAVSHSTLDASAAGLTGLPTQMAQPLSGSAATDARGSPADTAQHDDSRQLQHQQQAPAVGKATPSPPPATAAPPTAPAVSLPLPVTAGGQDTPPPTSTAAAVLPVTAAAATPVASATPPHDPSATAAAAAAGTPPPTAAGDPAPAAATTPAATPPPAATATGGGGGGGHRKRGRKHPKQPPPGAKNQLKGVFWDRKTGRWRSQLGYHNKKIFMGYFNTPQEAAVAYDKKAVELHGMLAKTNFPIQNYLQLLPEGGSALPTAEMAIPVTKKHTDTPTAAADGEGVSLHNSAKPHAAAAAAGGGAAASVDGSVGGSEGQGFSIGGNASEGLATGGDDSSMQDPQHQQQQQRQRAAGSGDGSQGFAEGHSQGMSPATAAAAATGSDGGVDVPVLPAAAAGGFAVSAPAERPARKKRKSAGAAATDHAQFATADAALAGLDMDSGVLNATGGVGMMTNPRPPVAPGSRQQQQQGVSHPGVTSTRGRGSGRRGAPRGPRPRGRPRSVISHQVAPGWDRSSGPEEDYVNQGYVNPGMHYRETQNMNHQYQDLEGYVDHMGAANHDHPDHHNDVIDHTSGSGDMMMLEQHLQGMASADISAAQALAGLLQLGEVKDEPDVQGYPSLPEQQRRQQPGYQDYEDEHDNRSWYEHQASGRGYSRGFGSRESQAGQHGVSGHDDGAGYKRSKRSSSMTYWQQQHDSGHGYYGAAADDEDGAEPATWSPQQHYSGGSRSSRHAARYPTTAAATTWQQQQPYHEAGDEYAAAAAAAVNPWIPRGHALRSGGLAGYWGSGYRQDNTAGYQMLGSDAAAAAAAGGGESQHGYGRGKRRSKKQRGLQYDNQPTAAAAAGAMNHWQQHSGDDEAAWEHAAAAALAALPAAGRHSRQLPAAAAVQGEEDEDEGKTPGFDQLMQAVQAAIAESSMEQQQRQQRHWQQQQQQHQQSPSSNAVSPTQMDMLQQLKELLQSHHQVLRQDYRPVRQQLTAAEKEREQAAAAAGAGSRAIGDSPHSLVTMLSSVLSPRAAAAAAPMQADTHLTAAATPLAAEYAPAAAAPSVVTGDDLIDEALLLLPPDQQDIINQQPALKALLGKLVGGSQISGTAAQHRPKQQQQYGLQRSSVAQGPSLLSQTLNASDTPTAASAAATSPAAAAARQHLTGPASILSAMRPPVSKQLDPAAAAATSHPASYPAAAAAGGPPTQSGFKRKFSGSGFGSSHSHTRPSSGNARGSSEVNPGGVTFRKGQSKPLKLWGSAGQGSVSGAGGQGSGKHLSPGSSKGFGSVGLLSPSAAAAAGARSSSSAPCDRSVITTAADQQLQLPQLVPLPELKTQPEQQQQQQQQEQGSDELGRLVAALLGVVKPEAPPAAAAPADQGAGVSPAAAVRDVVGYAATEQAAYHQMNSNTFSSSPQAAASNAPGSGRGWNAATAPAAASSTPLGPITPAPQQQQQQQSVNHFIYIPPGTSMSPAAAAMTPMHTPQPTSAAAAAAAPGGNRSGVIKGGDHAMHGRSLPKSSTDMSASLSFREWQTPKTAAAAAVVTPSRMQRSSVAAAAATPGAFDPSVLRQSALAALQAANQAVTAGDAPGNAAAAAMNTTADKQQLQRMLHDLGLQLHVLAPHAMMLPDELQQLQQAAAAAIGSSAVGGSGSGEGLSSSTVLSCVAALPSVLSGGGGVSADVWDKVNACVTAAADDDEEDDNKPAAAAGVAVKDEEDYGSEVAVKVHLEVLGNQQQQQQRRPGHLVLLPIVVPLAASSIADDTAAAAAADNNLQLQTDDMQIDTATEAAATAPVLQQPQQQQQQEEEAEQTQESSDLARLPPLLRQKLLQLRDQIQEMQGGVLRPEQDVNWLLKLMVAAMRRKVQAKQQQLQQQSMQQQQQGLGSSRTIQTSIYSDPGAAAAANTVTPAVTGPAAAAAASLARSSSSGGGGRTVTTGVATGAGDIGQLLAGAAAAGLLGRGSGSEGMTR